MQNAHCLVTCPVLRIRESHKPSGTIIFHFSISRSPTLLNQKCAATVAWPILLDFRRKSKGCNVMPKEKRTMNLHVTSQWSILGFNSSTSEKRKKGAWQTCSRHARLQSSWRQRDVSSASGTDHTLIMLSITDTYGYIKPVICALRFCTFYYSLSRGRTSKTTTSCWMVFVSQNGHGGRVMCELWLSLVFCCFVPTSIRVCWQDSAEPNVGSCSKWSCKMKKNGALVLRTKQKPLRC